MKEKAGKWTPWLLMAAVALIACVTLGVSIWGGEKQSGARGESVTLDASGHAVTAAENCVLLQTYRFAPCGHQVTRRVKLPGELAGCGFDDVQQHYDLWTVDTFSAELVSMSREEKIYCPMHLVLMPDEAGQVCVFKNVYGDGMAFERETDYAMDRFDEENQKKLFQGVGFDDEDALNRWLSQHAS